MSEQTPRPDEASEELAAVIEGIEVERQVEHDSPDPDATTAESPGVAAVRARLEEPFDYGEPDVEEQPNADGYT